MESLDSVALYFKEIRKTPLLNQEEFAKLWGKFQSGTQATEKLTKLTKSNGDTNVSLKRKLQREAKIGEEAKIALMVGNLRLVIPIAKRYYRPGLGFLDLIEEGNIGLMHALKKFDAERGFRFSTYASYWIDQAVRRSIEEQSKTIRIPPHAWEALRKWFKEWENLTAQLGRNPTLTEMAQKLNLTARQVKGVLEAVEASRGIGSLDSSLDDEENLSLKDVISDESRHEPDKVFSLLRLHDEISSALAALPEREREVIELRFGVNGGESLTLEEVGKRYKISRERVRQIQEKAISHLKQIAKSMGIN